MRRIVYALIFLIKFSHFVFAQADIPVNVKANELKYFEASGLVEASGSVEVKFEEATIYADRLRMDSATNVATAEGRVRFTAGGYHADAESIIYDADRRVPTFFGFKAQFVPQKISGKLYVTARQLRELKNKMSGGPGTVTTCDLSRPHAFILADQIEYYPDDRVEGRNVTIFVGEMPVLWVPYLVYDLKRPEKKNWVFGRNEAEGEFFKTAWNYPLGLLLIDFMEKKGWGYGTDIGYGLAALGLGTLYLYHLDEKDTANATWISKIEHEKQINSLTKLKLNHRYTSAYLLPSGRVDQTEFGLDLRHADPARWNLRLNMLDDRMAFYERGNLQLNQSLGSVFTDYYYNYEFSKKDPEWIRKSQRFFHRRPLWGNWMFSTTINYYHSVTQKGDSGEEKVEPQIEITGAEPYFSWRYTENRFIDLRQQLYPGVPRYEFLEKRPEIEIYPRTLDLKLFSLQSTLGYGYYREVKRVPELGANRHFATRRYRGTLNAGKNIPLGLGTVMLLGAGMDQFLYEPGDQLYACRENAGLQTNLFSFFRNEISYQKGYFEGNTPFFFDRLGTSYHSLREKATFYYLDKINWSVEGGRNWQTRQWFDVMTHLLISPDPRLRFTLITGWDIENTRYKDLVTSLRLAPGNFLSVDLSAAQDLNAGQLRSGSMLYNLCFLGGAPNQTRLSFSQIFDPSSGDFKVRDIMVIKELHCWEMKFAYSDYRKEFSLSFSLKALPGEPVGFSTGRGFYYEGFERQLKELQMEGEIRRY